MLQFSRPHRILMSRRSILPKKEFGETRRGGRIDHLKEAHD
jgi:hypothetical protein